MTGRDWGAEAHEAAAKHLEAIYEAEHEGVIDLDESPAMGPWDGCDTCLIREILHAAWPVIEAAVRSGDFDERPVIS